MISNLIVCHTVVPRSCGLYGAEGGGATDYPGIRRPTTKGVLRGIGNVKKKLSLSAKVELLKACIIYYMYINVI